MIEIRCFKHNIKCINRHNTDHQMNKLVRKAGSVVGIELDKLEAVAEDRMRRKLDAILRNPSHPLYDELTQMGSTFSHRLIPPRHTTKCFGQSFVPVAIRLHIKLLSKLSCTYLIYFILIFLYFYFIFKLVLIYFNF